MKSIKNMLELIKKFFVKKDNIMMLKSPEEEKVKEEKKEKFLASIKIDILKKNNKEIETLVCVGDGLGIQKKVKF